LKNSYHRSLLKSVLPIENRTTLNMLNIKAFVFMVVALAFGPGLAAASPYSPYSLFRKTARCDHDICFTTKFNNHSVTSPSVVWLTAVFDPKFSGEYASLGHFTLNLTIGDTYMDTHLLASIDMDVETTTCGFARNFGDDYWRIIVPMPGHGSTFLSGLLVPVPEGVDWAHAPVTWCANVGVASAKAQTRFEVQIAAAVYNNCTYDIANPVACETPRSSYYSGTPTGCLANVIAGGTGDGGSDYTGKLGDKVTLCEEPSSYCLNSMPGREL